MYGPAGGGDCELGPVNSDRVTFRKGRVAKGFLVPTGLDQDCKANNKLPTYFTRWLSKLYTILAVKRITLAAKL